MAVILENKQVAAGIYSMLLQDAPSGAAGQFVMVRIPGVLDPLLPRPISICDNCDGHVLRLLYQTVGKGTDMLSRMQIGQALDVVGPYGNGFPLPEGDATLIGGGIGTAPLLLLARTLRASKPDRHITVHLGFRDAGYCEEDFSAYANHVNAKLGGFITEDVDFLAPGHFFACGPEPMLHAAYRRAKQMRPPGQATNLFVSLEKRMACGTGACRGCAIDTARGRRRVCKDGPVFCAEEVFFDV